MAGWGKGQKDPAAIYQVLVDPNVGAMLTPL